MVFIREATVSDLPAIADIANARLATTTWEWTETPHTVDERRRWLEQQNAAGLPVLVAVEDDDVVGWTAYADFRDSTRWPGYRYTVEHTVHVRETHWGRGVGRDLIETLTDHARQAGIRVMVAGIDGDNVDSIRFHERLGFLEVARMPEVGEKFGRRLDLVLMQRKVDARS